jgi:hypothetical protein
MRSRLFILAAVFTCLLATHSQARLSFYYSLDIGSDLEMSNGGPHDPGDILLMGVQVKDDLKIFSADPPPPTPPLVIGALYEEGVEAGFFDLDGEDQLDVMLILQDGPVPMQPGFGLLKNPANVVLSVDDDGAPGWYSWPGGGYPTGDVPVNAAPDHGADVKELVRITGTFGAWGPNPGTPLSTETALGLPSDPGQSVDDDDVDALDVERRRFWYWSSDHEATMGTDPADIYVSDTTGTGMVAAVDNTLIGVANGTDIDAFEFVVTDDPAILGQFGLAGGPFLALLFSVDQDDPITTITDESGGLTPSVIYISLLTGATPYALSNREDGDIDALTVYDEQTEKGWKWEQLPDLEPTGIDVNATYIEGQSQYLLADDFECTQHGAITNITVWGSWLYDKLPDGSPSNVMFALSFHSDIPTNVTGVHSMPGETLWHDFFEPGRFAVERENAELNSLREGWLDPALSDPHFEPNGDSNCWKYTFSVPLDMAFVQTGTVENPVVYWLDVQAYPMDQGNLASFGWKTTTNHWNDDATWIEAEEPYEGPWNELVYPNGHQYEFASIDLAFRLESGEAVDFGDAPDTYGTTLAANGARHTIAGPWLGDTSDYPDAEADGQPTANAQGDDNAGFDDEDGVWIATGTELVRGVATNYNLTVNGGGGVFQLWIDYDRNGVFDPIGELVTSTSLADGYHVLTITAPTNAVEGTSFYRSRISTLGGLLPTGSAADGEVEDHQINLADGYLDWGNLQWPPATTSIVGTASVDIYGRCWLNGQTEGPGQAPGVTAELGYGPAGSAAPGNVSWTWVSAAYNPAVTNNNDEYVATVSISSTGTYSYAYRYSRNGLDWTYGDRDGSNNGWANNQAGTIVVDALDPFAITNISVVSTTDTATVAWEAVDRVVYQMQYVTNLSTNTPPWSNIGSEVTGPSNVQSDTNAMDRRFYRIVAPYAGP